MSDTTETTETAPEAPEEPTETVPETEPTTKPETDSEEPQVPQDGSDGASSAPAEPEVVNDEDGQHVDVPQPDGSVKEVTTRNHTLPVTNAEQAEYEKTHTGDQPRYAFKPGDKEYNAYSDPVVPNSHLARQVETEIISYAERVLENPKAEISNIWNGLKGVFDGELEKAIETGVDVGKAAL